MWCVKTIKITSIGFPVMVSVEFDDFNNAIALTLDLMASHVFTYTVHTLCVHNLTKTSFEFLKTFEMGGAINEPVFVGTGHIFFDNGENFVCPSNF
jgi:hypothetical protein